MLITGSGLLAGMVTAPALLAALAFGFGWRAPRRFAQAGAVTAGVGFLSAVALAVGSGAGDAAAAGLLGAHFAADRLAAVLLLLVFGVSGIAQTFAMRYLAGDPRAHWFTAGAGLLTAASAGLTSAADLITLAACWTAAGIALCLLLGTYWRLPAARDGVRRTAIAFVIGDAALWAAVLTVTATWGRIELGAGALAGPISPVIGLLVVVAALSRSAQIPFHHWLPATLAAPTPVSALLHAGVVNAGGILLVRTAPLVTDDLARALTIGAGAATMAYGAAVMLVKPDIKGALAHSTIAQMGFMILTCGLGLWAAAVIHLVAHGFYKATLFLSSGSAIAGHRRRGAAPPVAPPTRMQVLARGAASVATPLVALGAAVALVPLAPGEHAAEQALLIFAAVTGAATTWGWMGRRSGLSGAVIAGAFLVPAAVAYVAIVNAVSGFLAPALPAAGLSVAAVWVITVGAALLLGALALARRIPAADGLRRAIYTSALTAGHVHVAPVMTGARS